MSSNDEPTSGDGEHDDAETAAMLERFGATLRSAAVWEDLPDDLADRVAAQVDALRSGDGQIGTTRRRARRRLPGESR